MPEEELLERLGSGRPLRIKLGVDPTASDVTLGWAVVLRKLRHFQDLGHKAVLVIGDFTAQIGDPSGKDSTRKQLTKHEVDEFIERIQSQFFKILLPDPDLLEVRRNSEWLAELDVEDFVRRVASRIPLRRLIEREDFRSRLEKQAPLSLHEVLYPTFQAYDSVAIEADVELGGRDQRLNLLIGRDLMESTRHVEPEFNTPSQVCIMMPLLIGLDGKEKMSQSLGNYISLVDEPNDMFGKAMSIPDELLSNYLELATDLPEESYRAELERLARGEGNPRDLKLELATELVRLYHGPDEALQARQFFIDTFSRKSVDREQVAQKPIPVEAFKDGVVSLPLLVASLEFAKSNSAARKLIESGAVSLEGEKVTDPFATFESADLEGKLLRVGKHQFAVLTAPDP